MTRNKIKQPASLFQINLSRRLCALQTGGLDRPSLSITLDRGETSAGWARHALLLTAALTEAYTRDQPLLVDVSNAPAFRKDAADCYAPAGCYFDNSLFYSPAVTYVQPETWSQDRLRAHYLQGAGLLWLRQRTASHTGCHLAASMLSALLHPSPDMQNMLTYVVEEMASTRKPAAVYNNETAHLTMADLSKAVADSEGRTIWLMQGDMCYTEIVQTRFPAADIRHLQLPQINNAELLTLFKAFSISFSDHYIGGLDDMWVKVGLLLRLARKNTFPQISSGTSQWKDAWGFASCTAEEFRVHQKVAAAAISFEDALALPAEVKLPGADYISTKSGWSGRNSDVKLCANITIPPPPQAPTVDELLQQGSTVVYDCSGGSCPTALPLAEQTSGAYNFQGSFTEEQRAAEYDGSAAQRRCGFMAPSGFDLLRDYQGFADCKVVVVTLVARGRDVLLNVQNVAAHNLADKRVCFIAIMDINGLLTHQLQPPPRGGLMRHGHWAVVALLNSPWEGTTEVPWLRGARDANVLRHLRFRAFPRAEYSMWIDGKHQLAADPVTLFSGLLNGRAAAAAVFHHENQRCVYKEHEVIKGLAWTAAIPGYRQLIGNVSARYRKEGMPAEVDGRPQGAYDLAIIVSRHVDAASALSCLAYAEIEAFTSRNQLHFPYTVWRAGAKPILFEAPNCAAWMYTRYVGHWTDHQGAFGKALL